MQFINHSLYDNMSTIRNPFFTSCSQLAEPCKKASLSFLLDNNSDVTDLQPIENNLCGWQEFNKVGGLLQTPVSPTVPMLQATL